ncbi:pyruvate flavodoxin/ferredoxin oxidoreductase domain protein, partial [mine drainage metagenome]
GYPITPATEIMEYLMRYLPAYHGVVRQAEDELAAINMVIGAAYAGARAITSTSGPGLSLMTEGIGHAGAAEIPLVVVDCQRVGPSTGQPTRHEQSDLTHLAHLGHGEFPRFILSPESPEDAFYLAAESLNLAERWRVPVILLLDQALSQNTITPPASMPPRSRSTDRECGPWRNSPSVRSTRPTNSRRAGGAATCHRAPPGSGAR